MNKTRILLLGMKTQKCLESEIELFVSKLEKFYFLFRYRSKVLIWISMEPREAEGWGCFRVLKTLRRCQPSITGQAGGGSKCSGIASMIRADTETIPPEVSDASVEHGCNV